MSDCRVDALFALGAGQDGDESDLTWTAPEAEGLTRSELVALVIELLDHYDTAYRSWDRLPRTDDAEVLADVAACEDVMCAAEDTLRSLGFADVANADDWATDESYDLRATDAEEPF